MKRLLLILVLAATVAGSSYWATYQLAQPAPAPDQEDQLGWLRREFQLSGPQFEEIRRIHLAYEPICAEHCRNVQEISTRIQDLEQRGRRSGPDYNSVQQEWEALKRECEAATLNHLKQVAAAMDPSQGRRYLELIAPRVSRHDHTNPAGLRL